MPEGLRPDDARRGLSRPGLLTVDLRGVVDLLGDAVRALVLVALRLT